jgi:hypothetical protein
LGGAAILYADAFSALDIHGSGRKEGVEADEVASALLLTCVVIQSTTSTGCSDGIRVLQADGASGAWCGLHTPEKSRTSVVDAPRWHWLLLDDRRDLACTSIGAEHHCCAEGVEG